jgi:hypothetical protein
MVNILTAMGFGLMVREALLFAGLGIDWLSFGECR